jgi:hypothetical protein
VARPGRGDQVATSSDLCGRLVAEEGVGRPLSTSSQLLTGGCRDRGFHRYQAGHFVRLASRLLSISDCIAGCQVVMSVQVGFRNVPGRGLLPTFSLRRITTRDLGSGIPGATQPDYRPGHRLMTFGAERCAHFGIHTFSSGVSTRLELR